MKYLIKVTWDDTIEGHDELPTEWEHTCAEGETCVVTCINDEIATDYPGHKTVTLSIGLITQ